MISRVKHKEEAKRIMATRQNKSGMVGLNVLSEILNTSINVIVTAIAAAISVGLLAVMGVTIFSLNPVFILVIGGITILVGKIIDFLRQVISQAITGPVITGYSRFFLYLKSTGIRPSVMSIFEGFDHFLNITKVYVSRWFWIFLWPAVVGVCGSLLGGIINRIMTATSIESLAYRLAFSGTDVFDILWVLIGLFLPAICIGGIFSIAQRLLQWFLEVRTWALPWVMADHPQYTPAQAINESKRLCAGHIGDLMLLEASFWGWDILSSITGGLTGILYSSSYKNMTYALVYAELKGAPISLDGIENIIPHHTGMTISVDPDTIIDDPEGFGGGRGRSTPSLMGITGMYAGNTFPMDPDKELIIGRDSAVAGIVISSGGEKVSRRHCAVRFNSRNNNYEVVDFSSNGVYVGGHRITPNAPVQLPRGTQIELGNKNNTFRLV